MSDKKIAIIPARSGSKRIPKKNIRNFLNKPILLYAIETAIKSELFDEIMVSTDSEEIADIAIQGGAKVPFLRSIDNSNDFATTAAVLREVLISYRKKLSVDFSFGCCIYPAAPLIQINHLKEGYRLLNDNKIETAFPVVAFSYPVWRGLKIDQNNNTDWFWPENQNQRSQDLIPVYHDAGQWYWFKTPWILNGGALIGQSSRSLILDEMEVQDIDTETDWKLAELKYNLLHAS